MRAVPLLGQCQSHSSHYELQQGGCQVYRWARMTGGCLPAWYARIEYHQRILSKYYQFLFLGTPIAFAWTTKYGAGRHVILLTDARAFSIVSDDFHSMVATSKDALVAACLRGTQLHQHLHHQDLSAIPLSPNLPSTMVSPHSPRHWSFPRYDDHRLCSGMRIPMRAASQDVGSGCVRTLHRIRQIRTGHVMHERLHGYLHACVTSAGSVGLADQSHQEVARQSIVHHGRIVSFSSTRGQRDADIKCCRACIVCLVRLLFVLRVASTPDPTCKHPQRPSYPATN